MKSYDQHLETLLGKNPTHICHRASALFPIFLDSQTQMNLYFLNYWKLKRGIEQLLCRLYLRDANGNTVVKKCFQVEKARVFKVSLSEMVSRRIPFGGSLEIEFNCPENLVFPFPAVIVHYEGQDFSTFVHSAQRTYNDDLDHKQHYKKSYVESGFNIYAQKDTYPFLTFINGPQEIEKQSFLVAAYNQKGKVLGAKLHVSSKPNETTYIHLKNWKELFSHLQGQAGCLKVQLKSPSSFPRLIVGNRASQGSLSVTHSYYDLVKQKKSDDFWRAPNSEWDPSAIALPLFPKKSHLTKVYFYPIYSPKPFSVTAKLYTLDGRILSEKSDIYCSDSQYTSVDLSKLFESIDKHALVRLSAHPIKENEPIPARIKVGYDVQVKKGGLPCNICTNFYPANEKLLKKKQTFKWAPLMPERLKGEIFCINDSPLKNYTQKANVTLKIYRQKDEAFLKRTFTLSPHETLLIKHDAETKAFTENSVSYCTFESDNPFITTYTFSEHPSKMMGGDHGF